jgi:hypothetical protein
MYLLSLEQKSTLPPRIFSRSGPQEKKFNPTPLNAPGSNSAKTSKSLSQGRKSSRTAEPNKLSLRIPRERQKDSRAFLLKLKGGLINYNTFSINVFGMLLAM